MQLPKPPKLFRTRPEVPAETPSQPVPEPIADSPRVWSPPPQPTPEEPTAKPATSFEPPVLQPAPAAINKEEGYSDENSVPEESSATAEEPASVTEEPAPAMEEAAPAAEEPAGEDMSRYARPAETETLPETTEAPVEETNEQPSEPESQPEPESEPEQAPAAEEAQPITVEDKPSDIGTTPPDGNEAIITSILGAGQKIIRAPSVSSIPFSDIWYTAEKVAYIRDKTTRFALIPFVSDDLNDFYKALEQGYTGQSSYAIRFAGESYRVERIITLSGAQYNCRKMPTKVPDIFTLGLPKHIVDYLLTLSQESGLILFGGPTGMGKTTSASALMQKYLEAEGGFMYTIEDPPEMPLDGIYHAQNGALGLCKQCPVDNERWGDGIKSALRSRPRYILVGEIRTPETASQVLRAATSGHLVLSTIHASTVEDSLESVIKYASGAGLTESLAADLLARGILAVIHQRLEGSNILRPVITAAFANPQLTGGDQMRSLIRNGTINLQTLIESQSSRLFQGRPLFEMRDTSEK